MATPSSSRRSHTTGSRSKPARDLYQEVTDAVIAALERGTVPWRRPWREPGDGLQRNLLSRRPYRGINQLVLPLAGHGSPWWLTFKQALALEGCVRKGERGTLVTFWKQLSLREEDDAGEAVVRAVPLLRHYVVFNLDQCDGIDPPHDEPRPDFDPIADAQAVIEGMPSPPRVTHGSASASYSPAHDRVRLPVPEAFVSPSAYYATAFHELGHATGHRSRLARKEVMAPEHPFGSPGYAREELVAEMSAAMLCATVGIGSLTVESSASYIAAWLEAIRADRKLVVVAGARAQRAADCILGSREGEQAAATGVVASVRPDALARAA